jgi:N-acetylmuramoyl-L-alanine amidase
MLTRIRQVYKKSIPLALILLSAWMIAIPVISSADPMNTDQVKALKEWTNWVATACTAGGATESTIPAGVLPTMIPEPYNGAFTQAASKYNVAPALLAALFSEENGLGGDTHAPSTANLPSAWANFIKRHPNPNSGWATSTASAQGPFQFLPSTWTGLGFDIKDINNLVISAEAAAKYAQTNDATLDKPESTYNKFIYSYNQADWYVAAVLKYYDFYSGQPGAAPDGGATTVSNPGTDSCGCQAVPSTTPAGDGKTIVLDPGHAPAPSQPGVDKDTNIVVGDYANNPEMQQMYDAAQDISKKLTDEGYNVIITKKSVDDYVDLKERADIANRANAALGVSLHTSPGSASAQNNVFYPKIGEFRYTADGQKAPTFSDQNLADTDKEYAQKMADARAKAEGQPVKAGSYGDIFGMRTIKDSPPNMQKGNVLTTQYFAKVPWVYNEQASNDGSVSDEMLQKYEDGIVKGVESIIPKPGGESSDTPTDAQAVDSTNDCSTGTGDAAGITQSAINLAWPEPFEKAPKSERSTRKDADTPSPAYADALQKYNAPGNNLTQGLGNDCGVFVATVMHASGADPDHPNSYTVAQAQYVIDHPEKYQVIYPAPDTSKLQNGDILILNTGTTKDASGTIQVGQGGGGAAGHTMIYVGSQTGGYNQASASLGSRSANLGVTQLSDARGKYMVARKIN